MEDSPDATFSGWESTVTISDVGCDICVEPDRCPVVVPKEAVEPPALPGDALTRSQAGCRLLYGL